MSFLTTAGIRIGIGLAPATVDQDGFEDVVIYDIGGITGIGEIGKIWQTAAVTPLGQDQVIESKTSFNLAHPELTLAVPTDSEGYEFADSAADSHDTYTIKITRQNLDAIFFTAQVVTFTVDYAADSFENGTIGILAQSRPYPVKANLFNGEILLFGDSAIMFGDEILAF